MENGQMQRRKSIIDSCRYLVDSYEALPVPKKGNPRRLIVLADVFENTLLSPYPGDDATNYFQSRRITQSIARELGARTKDCNIVDCIEGHKDHIPKKADKYYNINAKILLIPNPHDTCQIMPNKWVAYENVTNSLTERFGKSFDKRILFTHPSYEIKGRELNFLNETYDRIFPWEWEAQNE